MSDKDTSLSDMDHLEDLFATARREPVELPQALQAAMLAEAADIQSARKAELAPTAATIAGAARQAPISLWRQFLAAVGGWPALGGLAAASLCGLWIGLAPPDFLPDPVESYASYTSGSQLTADLQYDVSFLISDEVYE